MKIEGQSKFSKFDLASNLLDMFHAGTGKLIILVCFYFSTLVLLLSAGHFNIISQWGVIRNKQDFII